MNNPDHIFWVKILRFFDADPESFLPWIRDGKNLDPGSVGIRDKHPGSATLIILKTRIEIFSKGASFVTVHERVTQSTNQSMTIVISFTY